MTFALEEVNGCTRVRVTERGFDHISLRRRAKVFEEDVHGWDGMLVSLSIHVLNRR